MRTLILAAALAGLAGCANPPADDASTLDQDLEAKLLADYVDRINSNNAEEILNGLTDDIVYQAPHAPEVAGKAAVREWLTEYLAAYETKWEKTALDFAVSGDWAFERYAYKSTDKDRATGEISEDVGKGVNIYHHDADGQWRVARDGWSTDLPALPDTSLADTARAAVKTLYAGFAEGDMAKVTGAMAPDIVWNEAEGNPYQDKNPYVGADAIMSGLFSRLGGDWDGFTATPEDYVVEHDRVIVFGRYTGTYKATGKALDAPFVHAWTVKDGNITAFQQYTDTAQQVAVMSD